LWIVAHNKKKPLSGLEAVAGFRCRVGNPARQHLIIMEITCKNCKFYETCLKDNFAEVSKNKPCTAWTEKGEKMKKWYCIPHTNEIGFYNVEGNLTDFPRGTFLAYSNCCLVTGFETAEEAREGIQKYPCKKYPQSRTSVTPERNDESICR
jgi:hypothetical protein